MKYAKVENNIVIQVTEVSSADENLIWTGQLGNPSKWKEVAEGASAAKGWTYSYSDNTFSPPKPFPSWTLDENFNWNPPTPMLENGKSYEWDEATTNWKEVE
tara:strand:- start:34 stop:339 length:306 start_codon:yes stop_codon:yes gene_type:complete